NPNPKWWPAMAEPALKLVPDRAAAAEPRLQRLAGAMRKRLRLILLVIVPLFAAALGLSFYLSTGRYISTDNAYVGAQKVLITPDSSGKIARVLVREGQHVNAGDELFEIDPQPFRLALDQAQAKLATVRTDFGVLKSNLATYTRLADLAKQNAELKQHDV